MLLTPEQQELFDGGEKSLTLNFYRSSPYFAYPSDTIYPSDALYPGENTNNNIVATLSGGDIVSESLQIIESISNDNNLSYGSVSSNRLNISVISELDFMNLYVEVIENSGGISLPLFYGVVNESNRNTSTDKKVKQISAFDSLYATLDTDITDFYNNLTFPIKISAILEQIRSVFGINFSYSDLINDELYVDSSTVESTITARQLLSDICEVNGVFANCNRANQLALIGLVSYTEHYPSEDIYPSDTLIPGMDYGAQSFYQIQQYLPSYYGEYKTQKITMIEAYNGNILKGRYGTSGDNVFTINDNVIANGMSVSTLTTCLTNLLSYIGQIWYVPISIYVSQKPYLECGDAIQFPVDDKLISSYILQRTIAGLSRDKLEANGDEYHSKLYIAESEE